MRIDADQKVRRILSAGAAGILLLLGAFGGFVFFGFLPSFAYRLFQTGKWEGLFGLLEIVFLLGLFTLLPTFIFTVLPPFLRWLGEKLKNSQNNEEETKPKPLAKKSGLSDYFPDAWFFIGVCLGAFYFWTRTIFIFGELS